MNSVSLITTDKYSIIVGLGVSGLSCARYFSQQQKEGNGHRFLVMDTRNSPPLLGKLKDICPDVEVITGELDFSILQGATDVVVGPGLDTNQSPFRELIDLGVNVIGDIEIFARKNDVPVIAITGSNGKSTVTTLVGEMAKVAGLDVRVGGNIGVPVLDLLKSSEAELYVLELSSFQLETTKSLKPKVATVLNLQEDHMDRYGNMVAYHKSKQRIYRHCENSVWNKQDMLTQPLMGASSKSVAFTTQEPDLAEFGLREIEGELWLVKGLTSLAKASDLKIQGTHNLANALAGLALGDAAGLPMDSMLKALKQFKGLSHRCEWVADLNGVTYVNDSKGTNVGATKAAINGLAKAKNIILIAGGVSKGADFSDLIEPMRMHCKGLIVFGEDQGRISDVAPEGLLIKHAEDLEGALAFAEQLSNVGDVVLFSPACASFDMFRNFEHRGQVFIDLVHDLGNG